MSFSRIRRRSLLMPLSLFCIGLLESATPSAANETDTLSVSATVQSSCQLTGGTLNFGTYVSGQADALEATGLIGYSDCYGTLTFELDGGQSGNIGARFMQSGDDHLSYQLYRDAARTAVWGQGVQAREIELSMPGSGDVQVFGRIPGGQFAPGGTYTDTVNITLSF